MRAWRASCSAQATRRPAPAARCSNLFDEPRLNHHTALQGGVLAEQCGGLLREFFAMRRQMAARRRLAQAAGPADVETAQEGNA